MLFIESKLEGAYLLEIEPINDNRGFFTRTFCVNEFKNNGLCTNFVQQNLSYNKKKGTLRGLHFQEAPYAETKLIQCVNGEIYDVIVDIRENSDTYMQWEAFLLNSENRKIVYVPKGFAHGFLTLTDNCSVIYMVDEFYAPGSERGIAYNDKRLNIKWPIKKNIIISNKDKSL